MLHQTLFLHSSMSTLRTEQLQIREQQEPEMAKVSSYLSFIGVHIE